MFFFNCSFQGNSPNFLRPCDQGKRQHKDMQFWNWGPTTIWHNIAFFQNRSILLQSIALLTSTFCCPAEYSSPQQPTLLSCSFHSPPQLPSSTAILTTLLTALLHSSPHSPPHQPFSTARFGSLSQQPSLAAFLTSSFQQPPDTYYLLPNPGLRSSLTWPLFFPKASGSPHNCITADTVILRSWHG